MPSTETSRASASRLDTDAIFPTRPAHPSPNSRPRATKKCFCRMNPASASKQSPGHQQSWVRPALSFRLE
jgi:hypothetical protein